MTADFAPGSKLGDYVLDAYVGAGSFGIVWRGHVESTGETVAIKLLTGALSEGNATSLRGDVEVLAATAASRSPHVVRVLDGASQPVPYIVMEFVRGTDLAATLQSEGRLTPSRTIDVGLAIADALRVLNQARIVHRDIKPANVLVDADGVIKLTDFGVAKIVGYETITTTGQVAMTMAYAAPEIWEDDDDGDLRFGRPSHRSDLYALGILLYQCLCGVTPFRGNYGVLYRAHRERAPDLSTLPPETPASLREAIRRCLEKRQEDRPVDAHETHLMLERAMIELRESQGEPPAGEPVKFGPWLRVAPHPRQTWAFRCRHETSSEEATVEVLFADDVNVGEHLRRAIRSNSKLVPLGAERIIESNRLLLRPQESWQAAPPGEFQFWVAREDKAPEAAKNVSPRTLQHGIAALDALIEAAARESMGLSLRDNLTLTAAGEIYLTRVGLGQPDEYLLGQAMTVLGALPLDNDARGFLAPAKDFADLVARVTTALESADDVAADDGNPASTELVCRSCRQPLKPGELICSNCGHYQAREAATTTVGGSRSESTRISEATQLAAGARSSRIKARLQDLGDGQYELILRNSTAQVQTMRLSVGSKPDALRVELPAEVTIAPSSTERVKVTVSASSRRFGGRRRYNFTLVTSGAGGSGDPPLTIEGSFEDESSAWPMFAAASAFALLVALIAVLGAILLTSGGSKASSSASAGSPSDKAKVAVAAPTAKPSASASPTTVAAPSVPTDSANTAPPPAEAPAANAAPAVASGPPPSTAPQQPPVVTPNQAPALQAQAAPTQVPASAAAPTAIVAPSNPGSSSKGPLASLEGNLIYEAKLIGFGTDFVLPRGTYACSGSPSDADYTTPSFTDIRFPPGSVDLTLNRLYAGTGIDLNTRSLVTYAMEFDIAFEPGAQNVFFVTLKARGQENIGVLLRAKGQYGWLSYAANAADPAIQIGPNFALAGLGTGRRFTIGMTVGASRYQVFVDGTKVIDEVEQRLAGVSYRPRIGTQSCVLNDTGPGTAHIYGIRVYELAGQ